VSLQYIWRSLETETSVWWGVKWAWIVVASVRQTAAAEAASAMIVRRVGRRVTDGLQAG